ncbi:hypothetical protein BRADI_1g33017v3 [Brachypodium distachyon]|uniref:Uncharacterized protein n=1 Tax=Brachypodium distachyon TaxID=15368 RepID=A0A2K2DMH1_BRADI|nr:hypothetical protein BRADI_1g33017v3 [Brachypodium distachyon]
MSFLSAAATSSPFSFPLARAPPPFSSLQPRARPPGLLFCPCSGRPAAATNLRIPFPSLPPDLPRPPLLSISGHLTRPHSSLSHPWTRLLSHPTTTPRRKGASASTPRAAGSGVPYPGGRWIPDPDRCRRRLRSGAMESRPWSHGVASSVMESRPPPLWCGMVSAADAMETRVAPPRSSPMSTLGCNEFVFFLSVCICPPVICYCTVSKIRILCLPICCDLLRHLVN